MNLFERENVDSITVKTIFMINEDMYENVQYKGTYNDFLNCVENYKIVRIFDEGKEIFLNTDCIVSFELGDN